LVNHGAGKGGRERERGQNGGKSRRTREADNAEPEKVNKGWSNTYRIEEENQQCGSGRGEAKRKGTRKRIRYSRIQKIRGHPKPERTISIG